MILTFHPLIWKVAHPYHVIPPTFNKIGVGNTVHVSISVDLVQWAINVPRCLVLRIKYFSGNK